MAYGIVNSIMDAVIAALPQYANAGLVEADPFYIRTMEKGPLQDDPTLRAGFLIVAPDPEADPQGYRQPVGSLRKNRLHEPDIAPKYEVGGGFPMINYFYVAGWTPQATSKELCYEHIEVLTRRTERALQIFAREVLPAGIATDDEQETTAGLLQVFNLNGSVFKLVGGENEWYGKVTVNFAVYSRVENAYWRS